MVTFPEFPIRVPSVQPRVAVLKTINALRFGVTPVPSYLLYNNCIDILKTYTEIAGCPIRFGLVKEEAPLTYSFFLGDVNLDEVLDEELEEELDEELEEELDEELDEELVVTGVDEGDAPFFFGDGKVNFRADNDTPLPGLEVVGAVTGVDRDDEYLMPSGNSPSPVTISSVRSVGPSPILGFLDDAGFVDAFIEDLVTTFDICGYTLVKHFWIEIVPKNDMVWKLWVNFCSEERGNTWINDG